VCAYARSSDPDTEHTVKVWIEGTWPGKAELRYVFDQNPSEPVPRNIGFMLTPGRSLTWLAMELLRARLRAGEHTEQEELTLP
jgi:hypothetical protein